MNSAVHQMVASRQAFVRELRCRRSSVTTTGGSSCTRLRDYGENTRIYSWTGVG